MQVQAGGDALRNLAPGHVFVVAENGRADFVHVKAQLVHAARLRAQRDPCSLLGSL